MVHRETSTVTDNVMFVMNKHVQVGKGMAKRKLTKIYKSNKVNF